MLRLPRLFLPSTAVAFLLLATPVAAAQPAVTTDAFPDSRSYDCGDFQALAEAFVTSRETTFFDGDGRPTRILVEQRLKGTLTNSVTGLSLPTSASYAYLIDPATGDFTVLGAIYAVTRPGEGVIILDAGRLVLGGDGSVSIAGPHQVFAGGEEALYCEALA